MQEYVIINSPSQDYTHPDDHTSPTYDMTPGFKPLIVIKNASYLKSFSSLELHLGDFIFHPLWYVRDGIGHCELDCKNKMLREK